MEDNKVGVFTVPIFSSKPFSFNNIEENATAQDFLQENQDLPPEELFEQVYQIQQKYTEEMMRRRDARRANEGEEYDSYLDTKEKEQAYYDQRAKETTAEAMSWLDRIKGTGQPPTRGK